jgi:hypothetical protein
MATSAYRPAATRSWLTNWVYPSPQRHHASLGMCRQPIWGGHNGKRWATFRDGLLPKRPPLRNMSLSRQIRESAMIGGSRGPRLSILRT